MKRTLLPLLPTRASTTAAWVSVPLADSVSAVELLLYCHVTPAALTSALDPTRRLAFSTLVPPTVSAVHKRGGSYVGMERILRGLKCICLNTKYRMHQLPTVTLILVKLLLQRYVHCDLNFAVRT